MSRRLTLDEQALWARAAGRIAPLDPDKKKRQAPHLPKTHALLRQMDLEVKHTPPPGPMSRERAATPPGEASLDAVWDRKIRSGRVQPDMVIDLHGHNREQAYHVLERGLVRARARSALLVLIITGKGKTGAAYPQLAGVLKQALPDWLATPALRPMVSAMRPAHPRHGGGGAFYIILRRDRGEG